MKFFALREDAKKAFKGNLKLSVLTYIVGLLIASAVLSISSFIPPLFRILVTLAYIFMSGVIKYGFSAIALKTSRDGEIKFSDLFVGFKERPFNKMLTSFFKSLFTILWCLLLLIPGIVAAYSYSMTYFILKDNPEMNAIMAIDQSKKLMEGRKLKLFMLDCTYIGWILLSLLTCGLGFMVLIPHMRVAHAKFYEEALQQEVAKYQKLQEEARKNAMAQGMFLVVCEKCGAQATHPDVQAYCPFCGGLMNVRREEI